MTATPATDVCDKPTEHGIAGCTSTPISCDDFDACTTDGCDPATGCFHNAVVCDDGTVCTTDSCNPETGCVHTAISCDDGSLCTTDACDPETGCTHTTIDCDDGNACTIDGCSAETGCTHGDVNCDDGNACTIDGCDPATGCTHSDVNCDDASACTDDSCNPATGCVHSEIDCDDNDPCTDDSCDPQSGCTHAANNDPACAPAGCRVTGGGVAPDGEVDLGEFADILSAHHGGQVGAPCGCVGCFDEFDHIQGNWTHQRMKQKSNFKADDFNSLVCGCIDLEGNPLPLDGKLCGDREVGPLPRKAPANAICFTGRGHLKRNGKSSNVAFRVDIEDRGEPGAGANSAPTPDFYRMRIWVPKGQETVESLADGACCTNSNPVGDAARHPDIDDGGDVTHGNLQIHPQIPSHVGICPVPGEACPAQ
jgi:hypothetical protein